ncbi:MAG: glycerophosphodiester phosphodiesterase family protein [Clostridiales bacterium]|nr:glycerophosphodiester phosphodiesterase family protein [Clostridiales bacterium]
MERIKKTTLLIVTVIVVILAGIYSYLISGDNLEEKEVSWIIETPIAHRGLDNGSIPENSMAAFRNAIEKGYTIELDVQFTKDKELIVFHDDDLSRLTNDNRKVKDVNYQELKNLKLENTDEKIPTLKEVVEMVDNQVPLIIEIKDGEDIIGLSEKTYNIMKNYKGRYAIQSFNPFILEWFKNNASEVIRGQLSGTFREDAESLKFYEKFVLKNLLLNFKSKPNFIAYELDGVNNLSVKLLKGRNYPIISWTIENEEDMKKAYESTDNIIFDNILP